MEELKEYDLECRESDAPDRLAIDFTIYDGEDNVAWVWGKDEDDLEWECNHPYVEYDDDESVGECPLCGATCDWHWENIYGYNSGKYKERTPHDWHTPKEVGGIIKKLIKEKNK